MVIQSFTRYVFQDTGQSTKNPYNIHVASEHLKNYYKTWKENCNKGNSIETYCATYDQLQTYLIPDRTQMPPIRATIPTALDHDVEVNNTSCVPWTEPVNKWEIGILLSHQVLWQSSLQFKYVEVPKDTQQLVAGQKGKRRAGAQEDLSQASANPAPKKRAPQTCIQCHHQDCPDAFMKRPCKFHAPPS